MNVLELSSNHLWKAAPGCRILVVDGGAVRFDFPRQWIVHTSKNQILLIDREPPHAKSFIALRWRRIAMEESALPLGYLVEHSATAEQRPIIDRSEVFRVFRPPLEIAWLQMTVADAPYRSRVRTRMCVARAGCTQALILCDFPPEEEVSFFPVWDIFIKTLAVGDYIADPRTGRPREQRG